jgi:hypothetical protein
MNSGYFIAAVRGHHDRHCRRPRPRSPRVDRPVPTPLRQSPRGPGGRRVHACRYGRPLRSVASSLVNLHRKAGPALRFPPPAQSTCASIAASECHATGDRTNVGKPGNGYRGRSRSRRTRRLVHDLVGQLAVPAATRKPLRRHAENARNGCGLDEVEGAHRDGNTKHPPLVVAGGASCTAGSSK